MPQEIDFEQLAKDVQYLKDRMAIMDCISRHARGQDRHDSALLTSTYHKDGVDEHGTAINVGAEYATWANATHEAGFKLHTHNITTHNCEIVGDVAYCESYVIACLLSPDEKTAMYASGRYVDQLERRDGEWKFSARRSVTDVSIVGDASVLHSEGIKGYPKGTWEKDDVSYQRPVTAGGTCARW